MHRLRGRGWLTPGVVDENWALAICFHEAPEGTQIKLIEKSDEAKPHDIATQDCPRHVVAAPFA